MRFENKRLKTIEKTNSDIIPILRSIGIESKLDGVKGFRVVDNELDYIEFESNLTAPEKTQLLNAFPELEEKI